MAFEFQSLFWWKYCPGRRLIRCVQALAVSVSILVLVEVLPWARAEMLSIPRSNISFNPCSGGSIALGRNFPDRGSGCVPVSILVLVEVLPWESRGWARSAAAGSFNPCSGGSIALGRRLLAWICEQRRFNPCSGGSIALGPQRPDQHHGNGIPVSILVLVEVLPWVLYYSPAFLRDGCVSILVLVEVLPWVRYPGVGAFG